MSQFYISLIFIGIVLIIVAFVGILYDKKSSMDYMGRVDTKKRELEEVIKDAEMMLQEMNRFSEYLLDQMETKYSRLSSVNSIEKADEHVYDIENAEKERLYLRSEMNRTADKTQKSGISYEASSKVEAETRDELYPMGKGVTAKEVPAKNTDSAVKNVKYEKVITLSKEGLGISDIAKKLGVGKGEIELILGLKNQRTHS